MGAGIWVIYIYIYNYTFSMNLCKKFIAKHNLTHICSDANFRHDKTMPHEGMLLYV